MSVPGNLNTAPPPSSFDQDAAFYEESRWAKLKRKITEEPLIPLGCALTCWALYEATKAMRTGDKYKTNRMFRRRIYAQGFTILAMVAGSAYWEGDRAKRRTYDGLVEEKSKKEKHEAWLKELEIRELEEQELRQKRDRYMKGRQTELKKLNEEERRLAEAELSKDTSSSIRSVMEASESRDASPILMAVKQLWEGRR